MPRKFPRKIKRIVIKVGSSVIATQMMKPRIAQLRHLADQIAQIQKNGVEVILVSSGAIVLGMGETKQKTRAKNLASLQALAAIGQTLLMNRYIQFFKRLNVICAQILLTWDDFDNRQRYNNARKTLEACLSRKVVPVINENDTISTDEIKFGDNDKLSALVASMVQADLLLVLSDVEGFYESAKDKKIFREIKEITGEIEGLAKGTSKKQISKGGMSAKLQAVKMATRAKVPCVIANGETKDVLLRVLKGERIGTFFYEQKEKLISRKHWISFGAKPKGEVVIDAGAQKALMKGGISLLLPGIHLSNGLFRKNDVVVVNNLDGQEIGRGIINYSSSELKNITETKGKLEAIHCDNLVLSQR